ncbi:MAG: hypothetical protein BMS9Abin09_0685 [Gammaproteobacteria bacterium]|nr:MAG: hypothetical protein BMS9Abin09_0685 [Gammaproteobacteria bacterium]
MIRILRYPLQALNYTLFMLLVWYFSTAPPYRQLQPDQAVITVAFAHAGKRVEECRKLSQQELARLPPNMRAPLDCPRERSPVTVQLLLDGEPLLEEVARAPGLYSDLGVDIYRSAKVPAGKHTLAVQMNDNVRVKGPTYTHEETVSLEPTQLLVVNFNSETGKFFIR